MRWRCQLVEFPMTGSAKSKVPGRHLSILLLEASRRIDLFKWLFKASLSARDMEVEKANEVESEYGPSTDLNDPSTTSSEIRDA